MPSVSKSQQRLFGMVHAHQKYGTPVSPEVEKIADSISEKDEISNVTQFFHILDLVAFVEGVTTSPR